MVCEGVGTGRTGVMCGDIGTTDIAGGMGPRGMTRGMRIGRIPGCGEIKTGVKSPVVDSPSNTGM